MKYLILVEIQKNSLITEGLSERFGYKGIKIGLQTELIVRTYIEIDIEHIKAYKIG